MGGKWGEFKDTFSQHGDDSLLECNGTSIARRKLSEPDHHSWTNQQNSPIFIFENQKYLVPTTKILYPASRSVRMHAVLCRSHFINKYFKFGWWPCSELQKRDSRAAFPINHIVCQVFLQGEKCNNFKDALGIFCNSWYLVASFFQWNRNYGDANREEEIGGFYKVIKIKIL